MSIFIKGMDIPAHCGECPIDTNGCRLWENFVARWERRHPDCPLVEIPTPHGRLLDADKLLEKAYWDYNEATDDYNNFKVVSEYDIADAPTVIEAEGSEE